MSTKCHQKCPKNAMSLMFKKKKKHSLGLMLNSWFSLFLTDNLTPKLIIMCMWKITDVYFLAQSARKKNSNSDHNRDHRKENPSNYRNLWRKKLKAKLIYVRHSLICCHLKKKNRKKTLDIWEQFLWFRAPLGDSWWKNYISPHTSLLKWCKWVIMS